MKRRQDAWEAGDPLGIRGAEYVSAELRRRQIEPCWQSVLAFFALVILVLVIWGYFWCTNADELPTRTVAISTATVATDPYSHLIETRVLCVDPEERDLLLSIARHLSEGTPIKMPNSGNWWIK